MKTKLTHKDLAQFIGTTQWFRHSLNRSLYFTDGVKYLAEKAEAYWLIDAIASYLTPTFLNDAVKVDPRISDLHFWKLQVHEDKTAVLEARVDSPFEPFVSQRISYTDFPLDSISIWAASNDRHWILYLPSEH